MSKLTVSCGRRGRGGGSSESSEVDHYAMSYSFALQDIPQEEIPVCFV